MGKYFSPISKKGCNFAASFRPKPDGFEGGRQTYKKDVVTAFYLRRIELRKFTWNRNNAMYFVHWLVYS